MKNIAKYTSVALILSTFLATAVFANTSRDGVGEDQKANSGTVTSINGNTVTISLSDATGIKVGDSISVIDRTPEDNNRSTKGTVSAVGNGTFTVKDKKGTTITVNTSASTTVKKDGKSATLADIVQGAMVMVKGVFNSATNTITANTVRIFTKVHDGLHLGWFGHHEHSETSK